MTESDAKRDPMSRRRRIIAISTLAVLIVFVLSGAVVFQNGWLGTKGEGDVNRTVRSEVGELRYQVHLPPQHDGQKALPVVMALHGCLMTGFGWNSMKEHTQLNSLADTEGFIVVYPTQGIFESSINCWNSKDPRDQHRVNGEPALLAAVAKEVVREFNGDPDRVHVAGASSGAGTAVILGVTYPDVFASVTSVAGGEYALDQVIADPDLDVSPLDTARQAWAQMGDRARTVPLLIVQGTDDEVVPPLVGERLQEHWLAVDDLVDDGLANDSLEFTRSTERTAESNGKHAYERTSVTNADGTTLVETYLVDGQGHAWSGPDGEGIFTDTAGPDAAAALWEFAEGISLSDGE